MKCYFVIRASLDLQSNTLHVLLYTRIHLVFNLLIITLKLLNFCVLRIHRWIVVYNGFILITHHLMNFLYQWNTPLGRYRYGKVPPNVRNTIGTEGSHESMTYPIPFLFVPPSCHPTWRSARLYAVVLLADNGDCMHAIVLFFQKEEIRVKK